MGLEEHSFVYNTSAIDQTENLSCLRCFCDSGRQKPELHAPEVNRFDLWHLISAVILHECGGDFFQ